MKLQNTLKNIVAILLFTVTGLSLVACSHTPEAKADRIVKKIDHRLELNEQQRTELNKLKEEALADFHAMKAENDSLVNEIQKQLENGKLDRAGLKKLATEERNKRGPTTDKWIDNIVTFHEGLSAKQKETVLKDFKKLRKEMHE